MDDGKPGHDDPDTTRDGAPTPQAALLLARSRSYQDAADASSTLRAYASDVAAFEAWCASCGMQATPPSPEVVGAWLAAAGEGYALPTLRRRVAAVARAARVAGHPLDTRHPAIRETLRGIGRTHGMPSRRAAAIDVDDVRKLSAACGGSLAGLRDRALILVGFAAAFRRSELVGLDVAHVDWTRDGMVLNVVRSKTDTLGEGASVGIPEGASPQTCPVRALREWLAESGIADGPVFRKVGRGDKVQHARLGTDAVRSILLRRAADAGVEGNWAESISPHGLRAGFVTTAYRNGVPDEEIMGHTRHRSLATMRGYVRRAKLGSKSPAGKVGL